MMVWLWATGSNSVAAAAALIEDLDPALPMSDSALADRRCGDEAGYRAAQQLFMFGS